MKTDRTTKALLALIAIGLFLNVFVPFLQPPVVNAQDTAGIEGHLLVIGTYLGIMGDNISSIDSDLGSIQRGACLNSKIC